MTPTDRELEREAALLHALVDTLNQERRAILSLDRPGIERCTSSKQRLVEDLRVFVARPVGAIPAEASKELRARCVELRQQVRSLAKRNHSTMAFALRSVRAFLGAPEVTSMYTANGESYGPARSAVRHAI